MSEKSTVKINREQKQFFLIIRNYFYKQTEGFGGDLRKNSQNLNDQKKNMSQNL